MADSVHRTTPDDAEPFWEITITLSSQLDHDAVFEAVEELLHDMGEIGTVASQKWNPP